MVRFSIYLTLCLLFLSCAHQAKRLGNESPFGTLKVYSTPNAVTAEEVLALPPEAQAQLKDDHYLKASMAMMNEDFETAAKYFSILVQLAPKDEYIATKYAVALIRLGELHAAKEQLEKIQKISKKYDSRIAMVLGGVYSTIGEMSNARKVYSQVLKKEPGNQEACIFLAKSLDLDNSFSKAVSILEDCDKKNPKSGFFQYYIGKMYVDREKLLEALVHFNKAIQQKADFAQAYLAIGLIKEEQGKLTEARALYESFLKRNPEDTVVLGRFVQLMFAQEKFKEVLPYAERLSDLEPEDLNLKVKLGILYSDVGEYDRAINIFKGILQLAPDSDKILYYLGAIYQEVSLFEDAIAYYVKIPVSSALYMDSSLQIANMLSALSLYEKDSIERRQKLIAFVRERSQSADSLAVELKVILANHLESIENYKLALKELEEIKDKEPFGNSHRYYLASLYEKVKDYGKSESIIWEILKKEPNDAHAWNFIGYSLLERNLNLDKAHEYITKAVKLAPQDGYIRDSLGWYYYKTGKIDQSLAELVLAAKSAPEDVVIAKHLATVYMAKSDFERAKFYLVLALKNCRQDSERKEIYQELKNLEESYRLPASK